ncbi:MAG: thiamine phosphate synthase [Gammaproteobacteria bacterium]|nr:thiamine phosphate synthase [Gammaproteobacteria bacterium]
MKDLKQPTTPLSDLPPIVWSIAGSDSGGGAGIQADLLTFHDLGCHGCTVITANTAQNTQTVASINPLGREVLQAQLNALLEDLPPMAIKIGLLANGEQVSLVANFLRKLKSSKFTSHTIPVIYDPVAVATSGAVLAENSTANAVLEELLPLCDLITPNCYELEWLAKSPVGNAAQITAAAAKLQQLGCAVLATGGHSEIETDSVADYLRDHHDGNWFIGEKLATSNTHGTGCTLSSAIAALLAHGYPLRDACVVANAYVRRGLRHGTASQIGAGAGPVGHCGWPLELRDFPKILLPHSTQAKQYNHFCERAAEQFASGFTAPDTHDLGLYPIVDSIDWLQKLAEAGVQTLQLRLKAPQHNLREQIVTAVAIGKQYQLRLFINDYWQLAIECGAYGVHLGQEDLETANLAAIHQAGLKLGISTHGFYELLRSYAYRPSYLAIGAIFTTTTKDMHTQLQGVAKLERMAALLPNCPLVAIGGINHARAAEVIATGVGSIAVVTAITQALNYRDAVAGFNRIIQQAGQ